MRQKTYLPQEYQTSMRADQSILRITLTGPALIITILTIIISVHLLHPSIMATIIALAPIPCVIYNDYSAFIALGPGGTPSTFAGYIKITYLRLFTLSDPFTPPLILGPIRPVNGYLPTASTWLPQRPGPRPCVAGIAPQRQLDQKGCPIAHQTLRAALYDVAARDPSKLRTGVSCFEKKGLALFALNPMNNTCRGEICHVHHTDGSLHLNLHPMDAAVMLDHGWGQRHPLAKGGWMKKYVPREFVMVYAPRNQAEVEIVARIIEAAAWWVTGERMEIVVPDQVTLAGVEDK